MSIWDGQTGKLAHALRSAGPVHALALYASDTHVASGGRSAALVLHSLLTGAEAGRIAVASPIRALHASPFRANMVAGALDDGTVVVWDAAARAVSQALSKAHNAPASAVCFSPANRALLVSAGLDRAAVFVDLAQKRPIRTLQHDAPLHSAAFSPDGNCVALGAAAGRTLLFDMRATQQPLRSYAAHSATEPVRALAFTSAAPTAATAGAGLPRAGPAPGTASSAATPPAAPPQTPLNKALNKAADVMEVFSPVAGDAAPPPSAAARPPLRSLLPGLAAAAAGSARLPPSGTAAKPASLSSVVSLASPYAQPPSAASSAASTPVLPAGASVAATPKASAPAARPPFSASDHSASPAAAPPPASASAAPAPRSQARVTMATASPATATVSAPPSAPPSALHSPQHDSILSPLASSGPASRPHQRAARATPNASVSMLAALPLSERAAGHDTPSAASPAPATAEQHTPSSAGLASPIWKEERGAAVGAPSDEALERLRSEVRGDVRALHLDMLRQFHAHQTDTAALISAALAPLLDELARLRAENAELRRRLP